MAVITIENKPYEVEAGDKNLLEVCLSLGFDLPYFCWHPAMHSVGACRQCAVKLFKDEHDTKGEIVMSCMTGLKDGMRISIDDPDAVAFRARVIEWLMVNHPHDCPVCDEGGECHLQDMTVMTGHVYRRNRFAKRTHRNQDLGPFVNHEMNRCIQCYRCVRFYRDYAGGRDLDALGWHDHVYFGRHRDGVLESEFSGNLVEVCPTGVFTDKTLKQHYARKWDLQTAPSICVNCGLGCNTIPGERYGTLRRVQTRYNFHVNGYFLCDRGRYGYEFVNSERRIREPRIRDASGKLMPAAPEETLKAVAGWFSEGLVIGIGSPRASLEDNFALRSLVGADHFYHGVSDLDFQLTRLMVEILRRGPAAASLHEVETADGVFVLGEDITNAAPMLDLAARQAVFQKPRENARQVGVPNWHDAAIRELVHTERGPLFIATPDGTKLDDQAIATFRAAPDDLARLALAVARELDPASPSVQNLSPSMAELAQRIAEHFKSCRRPVVISGVSCGSEAILRAAANVATALAKLRPDTRLCFVAPECNSMGLALTPGAGSLKAAGHLLANHGNASIIVLENDLTRRLEPSDIGEFFKRAGRILAIDHLRNPTTERAQVVWPASTFAEANGTLVNNEGRAQRFFQVFVPAGSVQPAWRWLGDLKHWREATENPWPNLDAILRDMAGQIADFKKVPDAAPHADFRMAGRKIPRQPHRYSGRTAMTANVNVHEPKPPDDPDSPLAYSMEGFEGQPPSPLVPRFWAPGWNSVNAINKFQIEARGPLHRSMPGPRLIEPLAGQPGYFLFSSPAFSPRPGEFLILQAIHIFGSEELSAHSPGIAQLSPKPYVALNQSDAERLGLNDGQVVAMFVGKNKIRVPLRVKPSVPAGVALMPVGLASLPTASLPGWGRIRADEETEEPDD